MPTEIVNVALDYAEQFGSVIRVWLGTKLVIFLTDPDDVEVILNSNVHIDKSTEYRFFKPWLGEGLLISTGTCYLLGELFYAARPQMGPLIARKLGFDHYFSNIKKIHNQHFLIQETKNLLL